MLINVHVTLDTLTRVSETPAWIDGLGPLDADTARTIAADATWRRIVTDPLSGTVLDVGRTRYRPPTALTDHIKLRDLTCTRPGCDEPAEHCDIDHAQPFHTGGATSAANLHTTCRHDHRAVDGGGFHLTQNPDHTWSWTTTLGRTYTRPTPSIFDPGDNHASAPEYQNTDAIPRWAKDLVTTTPTPTPEYSEGIETRYWQRTVTPRYPYTPPGRNDPPPF